jgi:hypothetical protein
MLRAINLNFLRLSVIEGGLRPVVTRQYHRILIYGSENVDSVVDRRVTLSGARPGARRVASLRSQIDSRVPSRRVLAAGRYPSSFACSVSSFCIASAGVQ